MQKTLLKFLSFELIERVARLDNEISQMRTRPQPLSESLMRALETEMTAIKRQVMSEKAFLLRIFDEKSLREGDFQINLSRKLEDTIYGPYRRLCDLTRWVNRVNQDGFAAELSMFLRDGLPADLLAPYGERAIVFRDEESGSASLQGLNTASSAVMVEGLSVIQRNNPLGWVSLIEGFSRQLIARNEAIQSVMAQGGILSDETLAIPLMTHCIGLRLMGPAYYFYAVGDALLKRDILFLEKIEPALFAGLNHQNFVDKSLVITHEAVEKTREIFEDIISTERSIGADEVNRVLNAIEKAIPDRYSFKEKHFNRALSLQERLNEEILLSASSLYPVEEIVEKMESLQQEDSADSIYQMISLVSETAHTAREIINAGWICKIERSPAWLYSAISGEDLEGFERLKGLIQARDHLLLKSIETSEVHRMLLTSV